MECRMWENNNNKQKMLTYCAHTLSAVSTFCTSVHQSTIIPPIYLFSLSYQSHLHTDVSSIQQNYTIKLAHGSRVHSPQNIPFHEGVTDVFTANRKQDTLSLNLISFIETPTLLSESK